MILYTLRCRKDHEFEAWFRDSALYDQQVAAGELRCPHCGSRKVEKSLMAPSVLAGRSRRAPAGEASDSPSKGPQGPSAPAPSSVAAAGTNVEARELRRTLLEVRRQIEENFDYVGPAFAEEARRIHYGEVERRSIYGETSEADAEALREEGVAVQQIPWVPRGDS
ncbi:MAG: DUF1178 family protein [Kiloniellales bacterium]